MPRGARSSEAALLVSFVAVVASFLGATIYSQVVLGRLDADALHEKSIAMPRRSSAVHPSSPCQAVSARRHVEASASTL